MSRNELTNVKIRSIIESLLFIHGESLSANELREIIEPSLHLSTIKKCISELIDQYSSSACGITIIQMDDRYQMGTNTDNTDYVNKLLSPRKKKSLSIAAMETLTIIAYKQPITKIEVEDIRGVKSDAVFATLLDNNLIISAGKAKRIGNPKLYKTTEEFLKLFRIKDLSELPDIEHYSGEEQQSILDLM